MKDQGQQIETCYEDVFKRPNPVPPRTARRKIEAMLRAQEPPKSAFRLDRREFLKASAISGSMALLASSGLIAGRPDAAVAATGIAGPETLPLDLALGAGEVVPVANGAEAVIRLLEAYGVDYVFWLTDDEILPIADKLTPYIIADKKPHPIQVLHEFGAVAAADGYAAASEKVGVVLYGACQGPMNSHGALYNAYFSRRPIVAISALNSSETLPYQLQHWVDPGDLVREYTKWTNHFPNAENIVGEFVHAFATAAAHPQGPVLISTFSNTWTKPMPGGTITIPDAKKLTAGRPAVPNADALKEAAGLLVNAKNPLIIAGDLGRSDEAVRQVVRLAELLGAPVVETKMYYMSFPWDHPLHVGFISAAYMKDADVIFVIEHYANVPYPKTAKLISLDVDPIRSHALANWGWLKETDIRLLGETSATIPALIDTIGPPSDAFKKVAKDRTDKWRQEHDKLRAGWKAETEKHLNDTPISVWRLAYEVNQVMGDDTILYNWSLFSKDKGMFQVVHTNQPKSYIYGLGGWHLGQSLYGAIGAAVARPDRKIITCCGDLEWHMGHGAAALWTATHHNLPILYIIENNHTMTTTKNGQILLKGEGVQLKNFWAHEIFPPMADYSTHAKGLGIYGECVKVPNEVGPALRRAMDAIAKNKQPAILDIWTAPLV